MEPGGGQAWEDPEDNYGRIQEQGCKISFVAHTPWL